MPEKEDAKNWKRLIGNFPDVDFRYLEFVAVKEVNKETRIARFG
jgi:hypothetical protein